MVVEARHGTGNTAVRTHHHSAIELREAELRKKACQPVAGMCVRVCVIDVDKECPRVDVAASDPPVREIVARYDSRLDVKVVLGIRRSLEERVDLCQQASSFA